MSESLLVVFFSSSILRRFNFQWKEPSEQTEEWRKKNINEIQFYRFPKWIKCPIYGRTVGFLIYFNCKNLMRSFFYYRFLNCYRNISCWKNIQFSLRSFLFRSSFHSKLFGVVLNLVSNWIEFGLVSLSFSLFESFNLKLCSQIEFYLTKTSHAWSAAKLPNISPNNGNN